MSISERVLKLEEEKVFAINGRKVLGIRGSGCSELEGLLRILSQRYSILEDDLVLSSCMSLLLGRFQELDPVDVDPDLVEDVVTVYLGERVVFLEA